MGWGLEWITPQSSKSIWSIGEEYWPRANCWVKGSSIIYLISKSQFPHLESGGSCRSILRELQWKLIKESCKLYNFAKYNNYFDLRSAWVAQLIVWLLILTQVIFNQSMKKSWGPGIEHCVGLHTQHSACSSPSAPPPSSCFLSNK